jgi:hypothetical protein
MTGIATALPVLKGSILAFSKVANRGTILPQSIFVPRITVFHTQNNLSFSASPCSTTSLHNPASLWLSGRELDSGRKLLGRVRARLCHASTRTAAEVSNIMKSASTSTKVTTNPNCEHSFQFIKSRIPRNVACFYFHTKQLTLNRSVLPGRKCSLNFRKRPCVFKGLVCLVHPEGFTLDMWM